MSAMIVNIHGPLNLQLLSAVMVESCGGVERCISTTAGDVEVMCITSHHACFIFECHIATGLPLCKIVH